MIPWTPLLLFASIAVGSTTVVALVCGAMGWTVSSPAWALLVPLAMWAPAAARLVTQRVADREARSPTLSLQRWGVTGPLVVVRPLLIPIVVYGAAYAVAWSAGFARWDPGNGRWQTTDRIVLNLAVNLSLLGVLGTALAMGEEIGWRGYLQPRLDSASVRSSLIILWLVQLAYHLPIMLFAGYAETGGSTGLNVALFAIGDLPITFLLAHEAYRARSLWPAVFLHSFHNTISQWLLPHLFSVDAHQMWLQGEAGLLPTAGYVVLGSAVFAAIRLRGESWQQLAARALQTPASAQSS